MDRLQEGERYLKEAVDQGGSDDTNYHSNAMTDDFLSNRPRLGKASAVGGCPVPTVLPWKSGRQRFTSSMGRMHDADRLWEHAGAKSRAATPARCRGRNLRGESAARRAWSRTVRRPRYPPIVDWPSIIQWPPFPTLLWLWRCAAKLARLLKKCDDWPRTRPTIPWPTKSICLK